MEGAREKEKWSSWWIWFSTEMGLFSCDFSLSLWPRGSRLAFSEWLSPLKLGGLVKRALTPRSLALPQPSLPLAYYQWCEMINYSAGDCMSDICWCNAVTQLDRIEWTKADVCPIHYSNTGFIQEKPPGPAEPYTWILSQGHPGATTLESDCIEVFEKMTPLLSWFIPSVNIYEYDEYMI